MNPRVFVEASVGGAWQETRAAAFTPEQRASGVAAGCAPSLRESASVGYRLSETWSFVASVEHLSNRGRVRRDEQHDQFRRTAGLFLLRRRPISGVTNPSTEAHVVILNRIYTRTGDQGTTALASGERRPKYDLRVESYGTVDETNACIGMARLHTAASAPDVDAMLARIQNDLFDLGADLATPDTGEALPYEPLRIVQSQVDRLEREIDQLNADLQPLRSFVLPVYLARAAAAPRRTADAVRVRSARRGAPAYEGGRAGCRKAAVSYLTSSRIPLRGERHSET